MATANFLQQRQKALAAAEKRIEELEAQGASGDSRQLSRSTGSVPRVGRPETSSPQAGGFLAGAAQTALGVTGGLLLGNVIADMLRVARMTQRKPTRERTSPPETTSLRWMRLVLRTIMISAIWTSDRPIPKS